MRGQLRRATCVITMCPNAAMSNHTTMTPVGFEPTQFALVELESTPLDHSGKVSCYIAKTLARPAQCKDKHARTRRRRICACAALARDKNDVSMRDHTTRNATQR